MRTSSLPFSGYPSLFRAIFLLLFLVPACKGTADLSQSGPEAIREVERLEDRWMKALVRKDTAAMSQLLAPEFTLSGSSAVLETRKQYLETSAMPERALQPLLLEDRQFRGYPNTVVSTGRTKYAGTWNANAFAMPVRYTHVYARVNGSWKVVTAHLSLIQ
ncbi:nuclear transport factor 2 family protein [Rufibacter psychrotolerans]|uniref:nuclear transport factor 2 family protein n=1 Tax=Rufibacter psychrotolerans TaxID=2812556 RepID=UPI0019688C6B|nr:nuclear transport factor 2 family protein [Rufibacter sp. SYSU D00308]